MATTVGQILVNEVLPPEYRDYSRVMGASEMKGILADVAKNHPEKYREVSAGLMRVGNRFAYEGGTTLRLSDVAPPFDRSILFAAVDRAEDAIRARTDIDDERKNDLLRDLYEKAYAGLKQQVYDVASAAGNPFAMQVKSKARGDQNQLSAMLATPGVYANSAGQTIPMFIRHSYAEGLSPAEIWAGAYGARTGVTSTKFATRQAGELGKLLSQASIEQVVTEDDCGTVNGVPVKVDDNDNVGALLAMPAGGYDAGTPLTKSILSDIRKQGVEDILVRSPMTCGAKTGVCSHCAGIRETGGLPPIGYNLGLNSASALAERLAQGSLNCLAEGTLVRMADGSVRPIEAVRPGEMVLGSDLYGNVRPVKVLNWYDNGIQNCYRTEFVENGTRKSGQKTVLESTIIHKLLGTRVVTGQKDECLNWVPRKLEVGTKSREFFGYTVSSFDDAGMKDEPLAMLLGALLGDGCYTESVNGVHLSCADDTEISDLEKTLQGYDLKLQRLKYHDGIYYRVSQHTSKGGKNVVKNYLVAHGMYGKKANEKEVPQVVHSWSNHSVGCLLGGLIATDGSVYSSDSKGKPGVSFSSTSRKLVEQFKELCGLRIGILGSQICTTGYSGTYCRKFDQYQFTVTKPDEVRKLAEFVTIPGVKRGRLAKLLAEYAPSGKFVHTAFKRVSQTAIGQRHVYDIEVDCPEHIFLLANGLIVSNTKHSGVKNKGAGQYQGFDMIKRLATVPKEYTDRASVSEVDGKVERITDAPQGGKYVVVAGQRHYVPSGYDLLVKEGDEVEAGDQLSDGVINPADAVRLKGIGEGRRYFANRFAQAFRDSGYAVNRRNVEAVAKALVNNVVVDDEDAEGEMLPGDTVTYSRWAWGYRPRPGSTQVSPRQAIGQYLEQPALHYTIGTRVTKKVADELERFKVPTVLSNKSPVGVHPEMQSVVQTTGNTEDWMGRLGTTYLGKRLTEDVQRGAESHVHGVNPYPGMAKGTEFGQWGTPGHREGTFTY